MNKKEFIEEATQIHGDKYDYSLLPQEIKNKLKLTIICPYHGEFEQIEYNHRKGSGCKFCTRERSKKINRKTTEQFIQDAKKVHGEKYDYSKTEYKTAHSKIIIVCPYHGEFEQAAYCHLNGNGCPQCKIDKMVEKNTLTTEQFIEMCRRVHGNKYDYSKTNYIKDNTELVITCPHHGDFVQVANSHKRGEGCPECGKIMRARNKRKGLDFFIEKAKEVHGDYYDYSKTKIKNQRDKVTIICPKHGEFEQVAYYHLYGNGCPQCSMPKGEAKIRKILEKNNINYEHQKRFQELGTNYSFDFYLPDYELLVEFDGIQHFQPTNFFQGYTQEETIERFERQKELDKMKNKWCNENGYKLLRISYYQKDIEKTIKSYLCNE